MLKSAEELPRDEYEVGEILSETFLDLDQVADFLNELKKFKPSQDDKLRALIRLLKNDAVLKKNKVIIFTEFAATAKYLESGAGGSRDQRRGRSGQLRQARPGIGHHAVCPLLQRVIERARSRRKGSRRPGS